MQSLSFTKHILLVVTHVVVERNEAQSRTKVSYDTSIDASTVATMVGKKGMWRDKMMLNVDKIKPVALAIAKNLLQNFLLTDWQTDLLTDISELSFA